MSKVVARMAKMKIGNLGGIQRHNQRETENHSNQDIDVERSYLNYDLVNRNPINYREQINEIIDGQRTSKRAIRKDAVLVDEWIITSDRPFFEVADTEKFFKDSLNYFSQRCGKQNVAYATVHLDETTPHMHLGIVPMYEKRLSSKQMFTRQSLREIQDELPVYLQECGHEIERGIKGSEQKHLTVQEYKQVKKEIAVMEQKKNELVQSSLNTPNFNSKAFKKEFEEISVGVFKKELRETGRLIIDSRELEKLKVSNLEIEGLRETIRKQETKLDRLQNQIYKFDIERAGYEDRISKHEQTIKQLQSDFEIEQKQRKMADKKSEVHFEQFNDYRQKNYSLFRELSKLPSITTPITMWLGVDIFSLSPLDFAKWLMKYSPQEKNIKRQHQEQQSKQVNRSRDTGMSR